MTIVSQKVNARNEIGQTGFVRAANKGLVNSATGWALAPIGATPEAFTTDVADVQGKFPVVYNTDRMPYGAVSNTQYYYDNTVLGGTITTTVTATPIGKGVVSEDGGYILINISGGQSSEANNGLDVDTGKVVFGQDVGEAGDPAKILSDREIPMNGFDIDFKASNGDKTIFDGTNGHLNVGGNNQSYNTGNNTKTNERYNTSDVVNTEIVNAKSGDNYGVRYIKYVQSKNGVINTGDDAVLEYLYPQDSTGNNAAIHVSRGDGYVRNIDGTLNRNINLIGSSDDGIYVLGDHGNWLSRTDYIPGSGVNPPILSTPTTETLAIDTATGQIGRSAKDLYFSFQQDGNIDSFDNSTMGHRYSSFGHTYIRTTSTTHFAGIINLPSTASSWMLEFEYWTDIEYRTNLDFLKQATIIRFNGSTSPIYHNRLREYFKDLGKTQSGGSKLRTFLKDSFKVILAPGIYNITSEPLLVVQNSITNPPSNADLEAEFWGIGYQIKATPF